MTMANEPIEKKAEEYADAHFLQDVEVLLNIPWPEAKERYTKTLVDFGTLVISNQWVSVDESLPEEGQHIVVCFQSYYKGKYLTLYMEDKYETETGFNGGNIKPENVIAWMPLPVLPLLRVNNKKKKD